VLICISDERLYCLSAQLNNRRFVLELAGLAVCHGRAVTAQAATLLEAS